MTRTELERDRRAKVVRDTLKWGDSPNLVHKSRQVSDALDLLDAEDRASFNRPGANMHGIGPDEPGGPNHNYRPELTVERLERICADPNAAADILGRETQQFKGIRETLYGDLGKANEAPADDWSFLKGVLLGFFIAVALFTGLMYGLTSYD